MINLSLQKILLTEALRSQENPTPVHFHGELQNFPENALLQAARDGVNFLRENDGPAAAWFLGQSIEAFWQVISSSDMGVSSYHDLNGHS